MGTLEVTVCNLGETEGMVASATVEVNGVEFEVPHPEPVPAGTCVDVFDPGASFATYGIDVPGRYAISTTVVATDPADPAENETLMETITIERLEPRGVDLDSYLSCLSLTGIFLECYTRLPFDAMDDPHEIAKSHGDSMAIVPAGYEPLAAWIVADNEQCQSSLSGYFGTELGRYSERVVLTPNHTDFPIFAFAPTIIAVEATAETLMRSIADLPGAWSGLHEGWCWNSHEMTHLFLGMTPIPGWMDEGLASYMSEPSVGIGFGQFMGTDAGPVPPGELQPHETIGCRSAGFDLTVGGTSHFYPYQDLDSDYDPTSRGLYYATGACFWDHIASVYGHDAVARIVQGLVSARAPAYASCTPELKATAFLRDFVEPVIGQDISGLTEERFGFGRLWNGCEA